MKKITLLILIFICGFSFGQTAIYDISVTTIWNSTDHTSVPSNAHWSPLVGASHENINEVLEFGVAAPMSDGIKDIAETGSTTAFENEINTNPNAILIPKQSFSPFAGNNSSASINGVVINEGFPYITLVSMVAPSPDWFIAVNSVNMRSGNPSVNNGWKETFTMDMFAYDAGTDSATNYSHTNTPTIPRDPISMVSGFPINGNRMATITFTYNSSTLSAENIKPIEDLKIYPNPTHGNIRISNLKNAEVKTVEVFSVLGKLVEQISVSNNASKLDLDLSNLNKGMYLLKLLDNNGESYTQKLVIN